MVPNGAGVHGVRREACRVTTGTFEGGESVNELVRERIAVETEEAANRKWMQQYERRIGQLTEALRAIANYGERGSELNTIGLACVRIAHDALDE